MLLHSYEESVMCSWRVTFFQEDGGISKCEAGGEDKLTR